MVETHLPALAADQEAHVQSLLQYPSSTPHLNRFGLSIRDPGGGRGRGVYATAPLAADTLIEVSPVLLFPPAEYAEYGSKTQLDGYTFVWKRTGGRAVMALALGLGSLFNHHPTAPNVKYVLDHATHSISYTTTRAVAEGEELTISYGAGRMWWEPPPSQEVTEREEQEKRQAQDPDHAAMEMGRIGLSDDEDEQESSSVDKAKRVENGIEVRSAPGPSRPATGPAVYRITAGVDPVTVPLATRDAWIIDIPPTSASFAVKFLQKHPAELQNRDDGLHSTRHLRSFRTSTSVDPNGRKVARTHFLLCLRTAFPDRSRLVSWLRTEGGSVFGESPEPYIGQVPVIAAPTKERLTEWQAVWPCIVRTNAKELVPDNGGNPVLLVDRKGDEKMWHDSQRVRWAWNRFKRCVALARHALQRANDQSTVVKVKAIGSAVHVTHPFDAARHFQSANGAMTWEEREGCDWSQLTGPGAPIIGRLPPCEATTTWDPHKERIISTLGMTEAQWSAFNTTPSASVAVYTSPSPGIGTIEVDALDMRVALRNPLKHAVISAVSRVSTLRGIDRSNSSLAVANGADYLLTGLALFTIYEPCIYCCMALVHSRVSEVYFLLPSPGRGGCCGANLPQASQCDRANDGGIYAIQEQKGLNHAFTVWRWMHPSLALPHQPNEEPADALDDLATELHIGLLDP